ncbi:MAG: CidA/LrgA family protein [Clostridiales Family XIII bacterium]|nr:CidA/LrgA family protein [Clostridiales Family XIII bacterium]
MKYLEQFGIIMAFTFIGEVLKLLIPLSIPASIYGMVLLLIALITGVVKLEHVRETGLFLVEIMPILFIPAAVGVMTSVDALREIVLAVLLAITLVTVITMVATGHATQVLIRLQNRTRKKHRNHNDLGEDTLDE